MRIRQFGLQYQTEAWIEVDLLVAELNCTGRVIRSCNFMKVIEEIPSVNEKRVHSTKRKKHKTEKSGGRMENVLDVDIFV